MLNFLASAHLGKGVESVSWGGGTHNTESFILDENDGWLRGPKLNTGSEPQAYGAWFYI
jgi:hypothetical protein